MARTSRRLLSVIAGVVVTIGYFWVLVPSGCNDGGGGSSFDRCTSYVGTAAFSVEDFGWDATLNVIPPIVIGFLAGLLTWLLLGFGRSGGQRIGQIAGEDHSGGAPDQES